MPSDLVKQLQRTPLFAALRRSDLTAVSKLVERERYPAGSVVCRQGEIGHTAYFIESGELRILQVDPQGIEREIGRLGPGDYFGETSLLLGEPRDATVKVMREATVEVAQDAVLLYLNKDDFAQLVEERPAILGDLQMRHDVAQKYRARRSHFKWLYPDEVVVISEHRHNVLIVRNTIIPIFALLVALSSSSYFYWFSTPKVTLALIAGVVLGLILLALILYLIVDHRDEIYIVTNKRVVRREHTPLGRESRVDAPLRTVQDIQESQVGLLAQWYDFGDLIIETAGERGHVAFREIPDPEGVREIIFEQINRLQAGAKAMERAAIREDMQRYFDIQTPEEKAAEPSPPEEQRPKPAWREWVLAPLRVFTYFLPPLRYEYGDTITWRKHWVALLKPIALPTLLVIVSTIGAFVLVLSAENWISMLIGYGVVLVILLPWWLWKFDDWQNDIYQVTSTRIIDVERLPLFLREDRREASLGMIQNIKFEIPGALGRLLNYGSVIIETAGAGAFTFDHVKDPSGVQAEIFNRIEMFQKRQTRAASERHRSELLDWFAVYDQVRRSAPPASRLLSTHPQET